MEFKVTSTALYNRLTTASKVMGNKNSMPILDCFLFDVKNGNITITASDGEKYFITSVPLVEQNGEGKFCILAKTIIDSMMELPEQPITIKVNMDTLEVTGVHNSGKFSLMAQSAEAYPMPITVDENGTKLTMPSSVLYNGITRCLFATANDEVRLVMNGIYVDIKPDCVVFAGTDGRKLVRNTNKKVATGMNNGFILPKKISMILKSILDKSDENIEVKFDTDKATITTSDSIMHFRLIDGKYPNYNGVIPQNNPYKATVDRQAMVSALKRVGVFCNQSSGLVKIELGDNTLKLTGQDNEYATSAIEYLICDYTTTPISIGFSCPYLLEICSILESESITLELADPSKPGLVIPAEQNEEDDVLMLLMPMRVEENF